MKITTLTVDNDDGVTTTVHTDEAAALACLRENHGDDDAPEDDDALVEYLTGTAGVCIYIDEHEVTDQTAITVDSLINNGIERAGVSSAELMTHGQLVALLNSVHAFVGTTH